MTHRQQEEEIVMKVKKYTIIGALVLVSLIPSCMFGMPHYSVWQQGMSGKAELAKADQNRQIAIAVAKAKAESAILEAQAEVARAKGAAEANEIMVGSLGGPENYLRWRYIMMLESNTANGISREVIYTPAGGMFPITEAARAVINIPAPPREKNESQN